MLAVIQDEWARRPWWMNLMFALCIYMAFVREPIDLVFTSIEHDQEVWFGIVLRGIWAKATEPLHWAVYASGAWGFWKMRPWMWPWAAVYTAQIAIGTIIWNYHTARQRRTRRHARRRFPASNDCSMAQPTDLRSACLSHAVLVSITKSCNSVSINSLSRDF